MSAGVEGEPDDAEENARADDVDRGETRPVVLLGYEVEANEKTRQLVGQDEQAGDQHGI